MVFVGKREKMQKIAFLGETGVLVALSVIKKTRQTVSAGEREAVIPAPG